MRGSRRTRLGSAGDLGAGELGLALLEERLPPFAIVVARKAARHHLVARRDILRLGILQDLGRAVLDRCDRERGVVGDPFSHREHARLELTVRHDLVEHAPAHRLGARELAGREEDLLGRDGTERLNVAPQSRIAVPQAQLGGRQRELRGLRRIAHVAADREVEPAAYAIAADHRNGRLREGIDARVDLLDDRVVALHGLFRGALALELRDVGARHERLAAGAGQDDDPHVRIALEAIEDRLCGLPHVEGDCVVLLGIVEGEDAHPPLHARQHLVSHKGPRTPQ